jgi:membrane fusion protein (multidrug efflux system)
MSKKWGLSIVVLIILAVVIGFVYWQKSQAPMAGAGGFPPSVIASTEVTEEHWRPALRSVGSLVAINGINVSTEVNGIVSDIVFTSGDPVEKGQVLIRLDDSVDTAALDALKADEKLAQVQFNRASDLLKKKVTSKSEYDEAKAKYEAARALVKQQAAVIKRKIIRAPFSGLAGIRQVSLGQFMEAGNTIVGLQALDPIYVDYTLAERYYARIKPGQQVTLTMDAFPEQSFSGEVSAVDSGIDTGTRTLKVRATLKNADQLLRPGMFAEVTTVTGEPQTVLTLPRTAISFNTYGNFVFVINEGEKGMSVKRTAVKTGEVRDGRVAVSGLNLGTKVVRTGLVKLRDGMPVKIDNQVKLDDAEITGE